jgi:hypothetical protein
MGLGTRVRGRVGSSLTAEIGVVNGAGGGHRVGGRGERRPVGIGNG